VSSTAFAQSYPEKPITLIVPWPAGGSTDIAMRTIAEAAGKRRVGQEGIAATGAQRRLRLRQKVAQHLR
jgi:tripartite-type tricarboxylate transporter receptor subunit TctC